MQKEDILKLSIDDLNKAIDSNKITPFEIYEAYMDNIKKFNDKYGIYTYINEFKRK